MQADSTALQAPFPYHGAKTRAADLVWERFGRPACYIEPFFGSGAMLLARPSVPGHEVVNDLDGFIANFWRAVRADPDTVAEHAAWPVNEIDLHARHAWLVEQRGHLTERLLGDPSWYDPQAAGWWAWGASQWIGPGWCTGRGPWGRHASDDGVQLARVAAGEGVTRKLPNIARPGVGVHSARRAGRLPEILAALAGRLTRVKVACGDWLRVVTPSVWARWPGDTAVFLDPPYSTETERRHPHYAHNEDLSARVRAWCRQHGRQVAVALCGFVDEGHEQLEAWGWECVTPPRANGRYASQRERIWFSPACR